MGFFTSLARGFKAALGSFFGLVVLWAVAEAALHQQLQPAPARAVAFIAIAAVSLVVGILVARRRQAVPSKPDLARVLAATKGLEAALAALPKTAPPTARQPEPGATFGRPGAPVQAAPRPAGETITETVTLVLRRQMPPRFGEAPRSWLGGLPMLPDDVAWPRSISSEYPERGERPLHFIAQICCADLPPALWGGLGPRHGWLLLFIDPNQGAPEAADAFRILHTKTLGRERAPPADLGPVHDGVYTAWNYGHCGGDDNVPRIWRRWPVDLIAMPNEITVAGRDVHVAPPDLAQRLYQGAAVADFAARLPHPAPFTRRGALYALNTALHGMREPIAPKPLPEQLLINLQAPGGLDQVRAYLEVQREKMRAALAERQAQAAPETQIAALDKEITSRNELLAFLAAHATPDLLIAYFQNAPLLLSAWRAASRARLKQLRDTMLASDLDAEFTETEWTALQAAAAGDPYRGFTYHIWGDRAKNPNDTTPPIGLFHADHEVKLEPGRGSLELLADYYVDPTHHALIPPQLLPDCEAHWRRLRSNRPHRMGGYQDGVQSTPQAGPTDQLLLFQIASDDAMAWCWGDVGAYYIYIRPADLRDEHYENANIVLECH
jgi:hypothetical protein